MKRIDFALFLTLVAVVACLLSPLAGCSLDRWVSVDPGTYTLVRSAGRASEIAAGEIRRLDIDRDKGLATFTLTDGSEIVVSFTSLDGAAWPAGCPSNINVTRMEVLVVAEGPLTLGPLTFSEPLLVRNCPPDPVRVVLRETGQESPAGALGGGVAACAQAAECVYFEPGAPTSSVITPLPASMKGYELYSWQVGQEWHFTLVVGTNRLKTYEEVVGDQRATGVGLIAGSLEELLTALVQLPSGAQVVWRSARALEQIGMQPRDLALPPQPAINDVMEHAEEVGVQLDVIR